MEWTEILTSVITALVVIIGIPLALRKRKKGGSQNAEQLLRHLQEIGVKASLTEKGVAEEKIGMSRSFIRSSVGLIEIADRNINYINVIGVASQYGVNYFLDYLVRSPSQSGRKGQKKTRMVRKKSPAIWGRVVNIEWKLEDTARKAIEVNTLIAPTMTVKLGQLIPAQPVGRPKPLNT